MRYTHTNAFCVVLSSAESCAALTDVRPGLCLLPETVAGGFMVYCEKWVVICLFISYRTIFGAMIISPSHPRSSSML